MPDLSTLARSRRPRSPGRLALGLAAGCVAALSLPAAAPAAVPDAGDEVASLRAHGPAALPPLLERWDRLAPGPERDQLATTIDAVAGQRYATVSRLYWFTDLERAKAAAAAQHRPILALRMLGRLDEELSCANSRLFRTTLYANAKVSAFLRDHFVLYWSSVRPVPRVTIDLGDGRTIQRTTTGNSAHYVLDETGAVLDVLPGLYAPSVFTSELAKSVQLATRARGLPPAARSVATTAFHTRELAASRRRFDAIAGTQYVRAPGRLLGATEIGVSAVALAQGATMAKAAIEVPDLASIGIDAGAIEPDDVRGWATIGQAAWRIGVAGAAPLPQATQPRPRRAPITPPRILDDQSRALVVRLHTTGLPATPTAVDTMIRRLEQNLVADSALNEFRLRPVIRREIMAKRHRDFASLDAWIYGAVFHTPAEDAWLGLLPRTDFTGLPGDGASMP